MMAAGLYADCFQSQINRGYLGKMTPNCNYCGILQKELAEVKLELQSTWEIIRLLRENENVNLNRSRAILL